MSDDAEVEAVKTAAAGGQPRVINTPFDTPTMVVDGMTGATVSAYMVRLHLVEHVGYEAETVAKHNITLAFDVEQFGKFATAIAKIRDQMAPAKPEDEA